MPSDERLRLHDREETTPVDQPRQRDEGNPSRVVGASPVPNLAGCAKVAEIRAVGIIADHNGEERRHPAGGVQDSTSAIGGSYGLQAS